MSMLNWICPECGREVPAADPECPACAGPTLEQLPLPLALDPPVSQQQELFAEAPRSAEPATEPHLDPPPTEPAAEALPPHPAEPATEPQLDLTSRTASAATGTEYHSLPEHVCEPDQPAPAVPSATEEPQSAEPAIGRTASEATGTERASLAEPLCESEHAVLVADLRASLATVHTEECPPQSADALIEAKRIVSETTPKEGTSQDTLVASAEEARSSEPISDLSPEEESLPQPVAAPVEASSPASLDAVPPAQSVNAPEEPRSEEPSATEQTLPQLAAAPDEEPRPAEPATEPPPTDEPLPQLAVEPPAALPLPPHPTEIDVTHCGDLGSAITALAENILETIPSEPVLRIAESFQAAPPAPLLPAGEPFLEPSSASRFVVPRPNITVRALEGRPILGKPEHLAFTQSGPLLPNELSGLTHDAPIAQPQAIPKRRPVPGWLVTPIVVVIAFIVAHIWMQSSGAAGEAKPVAAAPAVAAPLSPGGASAMATSPEGWPFARYIEVTGIRVVADLNRHSRLHYIVVNHSAADLSDVALRIGVHAASDVSKTLFRVTAVVPSLGPFASKEITVDLDAQIRASEIPEWDLLRVDVQAGPR
jgi:hypothetical protein